MRVFISWSQERSRLVAEALRDWLQDVNPYLRPWISTEDISPGSRWSTEIDGALAQSRVGILCVTRENVANPWLLFEAGAISKAVGDPNLVIPFMLDDAPSTLRPPLGQFNAVKADEEGTRRIVYAVNRCLPLDQRMEELRLGRSFRRCWPDLERSMKEIPETEEKPKKIDQNELLGEVLDAIRRMEASKSGSSSASNVSLASFGIEVSSMVIVTFSTDEGIAKRQLVANSMKKRIRSSLADVVVSEIELHESGFAIVCKGDAPRRQQLMPLLLRACTTHGSPERSVAMVIV